MRKSSTPREGKKDEKLLEKQKFKNKRNEYILTNVKFSLGQVSRSSNNYKNNKYSVSDKRHINNPVVFSDQIAEQHNATL